MSSNETKLTAVDDSAEPSGAMRAVLVLYPGEGAATRRGRDLRRYLRPTLDPKFVDNTYGATAVGWNKKRDLGQLVGSDHAQLVLSDGGGRVAIDAKLDDVSADPTAAAGYRSLGVRGGDGKMLVAHFDRRLARAF